MRHLHFLATSVSVWGEYAARAADGAEGLNVTYGYSKDQRPDLKQFLVQMLCCQRNIPLLGGCADGNASDKTINNAVLTRLSACMARHGLAAGAFVYIADSALVTARNLEVIGENLFITRLPFTYAEAERVVSEALLGGAWAAAPQAPASASRKAAAYRVCEMAVTIEKRGYRAIVVHSDAGDKRRQKKLEGLLSASREQAAEILKAAGKTAYFCREDAAAAAEKLRDAALYHSCECVVREQLTYARGRPPKSGARRVAQTRYVLEGRIVEREGAVERARQAAGCFVLLTNVPAEGEMAHAPGEVLAAYKEQHGIERNFGFLKDPLIVNDIFLKRPGRTRGAGLHPPGLPAHLEPDGARDARAPQAHGLDDPRLGPQADEGAHHLHDEHQVQGGAGGEDRRAVALHRAAHGGAAAVRAGFGPQRGSLAEERQPTCSRITREEAVRGGESETCPCTTPAPAVAEAMPSTGDQDRAEDGATCAVIDGCAAMVGEPNGGAAPYAAPLASSSVKAIATSRIVRRLMTIPPCSGLPTPAPSVPESAVTGLAGRSHQRLPAGLRWPQWYARRISASRVELCSCQESRMGMAYSRSVTRSSVWGRRRCQVRSHAVPRDPIQAHGVGSLNRPPRAAAVHRGPSRDPRQEARDTVRVPRGLVVRAASRVESRNVVYKLRA